MSDSKGEIEMIARKIWWLLVAVAAFLPGGALAFPLTMTTLGPQLIAITDGDLFDQSFEITNATTQTWIDFHLEITAQPIPGGPTAFGIFGFIDVAGGGHDGSAYEGPGTYTVDVPVAGKRLDVIGISIAPGAVYTFSIDTDDFESIGAYGVVATATTGVGLPEPASVLLLAIGLAGLGLFRRRRPA